MFEMTRQIDFNFKKANDEIKEILSNNKITDFFLDDEKLNLYQCHGSSSGEYWYVIFNDAKTDIDFIVKFKQDGIIVNEKKYRVIVPYHVYKKNATVDLKNITRRVFSYINKKFDRPLLSDKRQSQFMEHLWIYWFENQHMNSVKDFKFVDSQSASGVLSGIELSVEDLENLQHGFYGAFEKHERYRMMIDFHNVIKEAAPIVVRNRSMGKFHGKEGIDWIVGDEKL
jgi:hypothetical protein